MMETRLSTGIKSWAKDDRPREKLLLKGPAMLSDAELLAILIGSGNKERPALDLAIARVEKAKRNLEEVGRQSIKDLMARKGIGEARGGTISAARERARRRQGSNTLENPVIRTSRD